MATTLLTLPTEIRMLILTSVLTASSGYVRLTVAREGDSFEGVQRTFNVIEHESLQKNPRKISLCILRTCKQVYAESRGLIFKALGGSYMEDLTPSPVFNRIRHAQLEFDFRKQLDLWDIEQYLEEFAKWAEKGDLRSVTLKGVRDSSTTDTWGLQDSTIEFASTLGTRESILGIYAAWPGVEKKINLTKSMKEELLKHQDSSMALDQAIYTMHKAIGGEMWVEGVLIWKDGVQIGQARK